MCSKSSTNNRQVHGLLSTRAMCNKASSTSRDLLKLPNHIKCATQEHHARMKAVPLQTNVAYTEHECRDHQTQKMHGTPVFFFRRRRWGTSCVSVVYPKATRSSLRPKGLQPPVRALGQGLPSPLPHGLLLLASCDATILQHGSHEQGTHVQTQHGHAHACGTCKLLAVSPSERVIMSQAP